MSAFIVFEGGDGAGKSTQARMLFRRLLRAGYPAVAVHEPGGTSLGERVRQWLRSHPGINSKAELMLFLAARAELVTKVIGPALESQQIVVCDRFTASTYAYQGHGRGVDLELIRHLNREATGGIEPDLTVLLDMPVNARLARKQTPQDPFELEDDDFHGRVRAGYLALAADAPESWLVVDGARDRKTIASTVWDRVKTLLG